MRPNDGTRGFITRVYIDAEEKIFTANEIFRRLLLEVSAMEESKRVLLFFFTNYHRQVERKSYIFIRV